MACITLRDEQQESDSGTVYVTMEMVGLIYHKNVMYGFSQG